MELISNLDLELHQDISEGGSNSGAGASGKDFNKHGESSKEKDEKNVDGTSAMMITRFVKSNPQ